MKKVLFAGAAILLLAAGCSSQTVSSTNLNTFSAPTAQNAGNNSPSPTQGANNSNQTSVSGSDSSNASLNASLSNIDGQMNGLNSDSANVDSSMNAQ